MVAVHVNILGTIQEYDPTGTSDGAASTLALMTEEDGDDFSNPNVLSIMNRCRLISYHPCMDLHGHPSLKGLKGAQRASKAREVWATRLQQIKEDDHNPTSGRLDEAIRRWRYDKRQLFFSPFTRANDLMEIKLTKHFQAIQSDARVFVIDGSKVSRIEDRQKILDEFERAPIGSVLLATIKVLQEGLDITCATFVLFIGVTWTPINEFQALSRAWRYGQKRTVYVEYLKSRTSAIDGRMWEIRARKKYYEYVVVDGENKKSIPGQTPVYDQSIDRHQIWTKYDTGHPDPKRSYFKRKPMWDDPPGMSVGLPSHDVFLDATSYGMRQLNQSEKWEGSVSYGT
jgi:hypothetical protein